MARALRSMSGRVLGGDRRTMAALGRRGLIRYLDPVRVEEPGTGYRGLLIQTEITELGEAVREELGA
jgi:hypothetical protein